MSINSKGWYRTAPRLHSHFVINHVVNTARYHISTCLQTEVLSRHCLSDDEPVPLARLARLQQESGMAQTKGKQGLQVLPCRHCDSPPLPLAREEEGHLEALRYDRCHQQVSQLEISLALVAPHDLSCGNTKVQTSILSRVSKCMNSLGSNTYRIKQRSI